MPADLSGAASHPAVAAVLAASPTWDGLVFAGTTPDAQVAGRRNPTWSPVDHPDAVAVGARQAAKFARWLADNAPEHDYGEFIERAWTDADLGRLADEIDPKETDHDHA